MRKIDYTFLKNASYKTNILNLVSIISGISARESFHKKQNKELFEGLRTISTLNSVESSNRIEGVVTTKERFKKITSGIDEPISHNEIEILGYKKALEIIHDHYLDIELDEDTIKYFHKLSVTNGGEYKTVSNQIVANYADGRKEVLFTPPNEAETKEYMKQFVLAYNQALHDEEIPVLLLIPCAIIDFLMIHPFSDGNGRTSRLLMNLMLYQAGYDIQRYISLEKEIATYVDMYYQNIRACNNLWYEGDNTYEPFIVYFLQILYSCYKQLDEKFISDTLKKVKKNKRVEVLLLNSIVPISKQYILEMYPDISKRTVETTISRLLLENKIKKIGTTINARYIKK